ncbi:hypothetical protein CC78DRAFT_164905 [Lojkania enalia]|uniref:Uncharacterized protein n=1 Tax=Lojkania enalia TaxID=147567 RepID=A0A9P4KDX6_9PLEO|nr:hypothetical protein CC78DRAFT_164905 [Didymosphaeria enalia]
MSDAPIHSTGRGGAGNIGRDETVYTDGAIIREGVAGEGDGNYSAGRGGAGNIAKSPHIGPQDEGRKSIDYIPENALRETQENYHTGRGGEGNVHKDKYGGHSHSPDRKGFIDRAKEKLHLDGHKKTEPSPLANETKE